MDSPEILYMVVPCYNEQEVLRQTAEQLKTKYSYLISEKLISPESRIVFVNDGSADQTWGIIKELHNTEPSLFSGIDLAHNSGHQNAVLAGLMTVKDICDMCITMDADLQDDINTIDEMVKKYYEGNQVVYGVRSARDTDTFFKKFTAESFYKFMKVMGADVVYNHADFRLMSKRVLQELADFKEVNLFLRGMIPLVGFKSSRVFYSRRERLAGASHYPFLKMLGFAADGITSLSIKPIRLITLFGALVSLLSFFMGVWSLVSWIRGTVVRGWTSEVLCVCFLGGIQLLSLGVIGEYIGKIYLEVKRRPRAVISDRTWKKKGEGNQ